MPIAAVSSGRPAGVDVERVVTEQAQRGHIAGRRQRLRHVVGAADNAGLGDAVHVRLVRGLQRRLAAERGLRFVGTAVGDDDDVFHTGSLGDGLAVGQQKSLFAAQRRFGLPLASLAGLLGDAAPSRLNVSRPNPSRRQAAAVRDRRHNPTRLRKRRCGSTDRQAPANPAARQGRPASGVSSTPAAAATGTWDRLRRRLAASPYGRRSCRPRDATKRSIPAARPVCECRCGSNRLRLSWRRTCESRVAFADSFDSNRATYCWG